MRVHAEQRNNCNSKIESTTKRVRRTFADGREVGISVVGKREGSLIGMTVGLLAKAFVGTTEYPIEGFEVGTEI